MDFKKFIVGFVVALSAAFALDTASKITPPNYSAEPADTRQAYLLTSEAVVK